jgi:hypothetical protein
LGWPPRSWVSEVKLAARGQRDLDVGPEPIVDPEGLRQVRRQARHVQTRSLLVAAALTALLLGI